MREHQLEAKWERDANGKLYCRWLLKEQTNEGHKHYVYLNQTTGR